MVWCDERRVWCGMMKEGRYREEMRCSVVRWNWGGVGKWKCSFGEVFV